MPPRRPRTGRSLCAALLLAALLPIGLPGSVAAQMPDAETAAQVLLDAAREFERGGRGEVAVAIYTLILERYGTTAAAESARHRVADIQVVSGVRSGRVELQVWGTTYGIWLGAAVPAALGADSPEAYGAGLLLGAPAGLLLSRAIVRSRPITEGQARAITWGGTWGTWQGFGWAEVLDVGVQEQCEGGFCYPTEDGTEEMFASMIVGGLAGAATGAWIARNPVGTGVASGAHYGSLWGSWLGVATAGLIDMGDDAGLTTTLLAGNAGLLAGGLVARRFGLTRDRIRLISVGGLIGLLGGLGLDLMLQPGSSEAAIALPLALSGAGLALGAHLTRDRVSASPSGDAAGGTDAGALLRFDSAGWAVDVPRPVPTLRPMQDGSGRYRWRPALVFSLISGSF